MNEPTPLTDALYDKIIDGPLHAIGPAMRNHARDLEEQLAAHRAALAKADEKLAEILTEHQATLASLMRERAEYVEADKIAERKEVSVLCVMEQRIVQQLEALAAIRELTAKGGHA